MAKKPETRLVHQIREGLLQAFPGCYLRKIHGNAYQHAGIPDIIGSIYGRFVGLEVKTDEGHVSRIQELEGLEIKKSEGIYGVVTSPEEAIKLVQSHLQA